MIVRSIALQYGRTIPHSATHEHYASLEETERQVVVFPSGIPGITDAMTRTHRSLVKGLSTKLMQTSRRLTAPWNVRWIMKSPRCRTNEICSNSHYNRG